MCLLIRLVSLLCFVIPHIPPSSSASYSYSEEEVCEEESVRSTLEADPGKTIIVQFKGRPPEDMIREAHEKSWATGSSDPGGLLPEILQENSEESQKHVLRMIENEKLKRSYGGNITRLWAFNKLIVRQADTNLYDRIRASPNVASVKMDEQFTVEFEQPTPAGSLNQRADKIQWGVNLVQAPKVWAKGYKGQGVVVGIIDTGIRVTHSALAQNFRKNFGWFDSAYGTTKPSDSAGHGTHVAGIIVGTKGVGVAPRAQIIACSPYMTNQRTSLEKMLVCLQWMLCPTMNGKQDCSKRPKVVNNSWGWKSVLGIRHDYDLILRYFSEANMIHIFAAGNDGPKCSTISSPAFNTETITVGSIDQKKFVAKTSSRGPTELGHTKPDIVAPGHKVISCGIADDATLVLMSGTSMAAPHVAGVAALVASYNPSITQKEFRTAITVTAERHAGLQEGGGNKCKGDSKFPNNHVGWGVINALSAIDV